jgi:hypothetical protein
LFIILPFQKYRESGRSQKLFFAFIKKHGGFSQSLIYSRRIGFFFDPVFELIPALNQALVRDIYHCVADNWNTRRRHQKSASLTAVRFDYLSYLCFRRSGI